MGSRVGALNSIAVPLDFTVGRRCEESRARTGRIRTGHGSFETPVFMPVGTYGCVKAVAPEDLEKSGVKIILANTYHLYLRPGHAIIQQLGGLHSFMNWPHPILTDSGGFQLYSLSKLRSISEEGVTFQSHLDGTKHFIGPKEAMEIQGALGGDIIMAFDECVAYPADYDYVARSVRLTSSWAKQSLAAHRKRDRQAIFGIIQGGVFPELRARSAEDLLGLDFDGYALGGLSVGEDKETRQKVICKIRDLIPENKPVYLMGVGSPEDLVDCVMMGIDMFDCVMPTRNGRNGTLFSSAGRLSIKNACFATDERPVDEHCGCYTCTHFSRAYLRHLFMTRELLSYRLNTIHNLYYYTHLMGEMRQAISEGRFMEFRKGFFNLNM